MKRRIRITISPQGEVTISPEGFRGKGCEAATRTIEEALGTRSSRVFTPAYHQSPLVRNIQKLGEGDR